MTCCSPTTGAPLSAAQLADASRVSPRDAHRPQLPAAPPIGLHLSLKAVEWRLLGVPLRRATKAAPPTPAPGDPHD